jgi:hypothetical protein
MSLLFESPPGDSGVHGPVSIGGGDRSAAILSKNRSEQLSWDCDLRHLKCDVPAVADNLCANLDQLLAKRR